MLERAKRTLGIGLLLACLSSPAFAEIDMPSFFSDGMVLQRETGAAVWGWAEPGARVSARFAGQTLEAEADADGKWKVVFEGLKASKTGQELTLRVGAETRTIKDVLVGEVWLASGQSNMVWPMMKSSSKEYATTVDNPLIRHYRGGRISAGEPQTDYPGQWSAATPESTPSFSAVAFHFAEKLNRELDLPVGIIETAWGGMPIQSFISDEAVRRIPEAEKAVHSKDMGVKKYDPQRAEEEYQRRLNEYGVAHQAWIDGGKEGKRPRKPAKQQDPRMAPGQPSNIFNGMVHPFVGYGIRGAIWYQGERNAGEGGIYGELLEGLVADWRKLWGLKLSFYWVQLANCGKVTTEPGQEAGWVHVQDEQRRALQLIPKSGMAVINDIGGGLHPGNKKDVGLRLARWALHQDYGKASVVRSGPLYRSAHFDGAKAIVSFDFAQGLATRDGEKPARFELAGADGAWVWGDAVIDGETVVVTAPSVGLAVKVRYAWAQNPEGANLVNAAGLPASCFSSETGHHPLHAEMKPNIIFILLDDLGREWVECYGGVPGHTPNVTKLAESGMRFENAYSMPQCTPSRATLLTGQYPWRHGWVNHWDVPRWGRGCHFDPKKNYTFARLLKKAGYKTAAAGKWQINDFRVQPQVMREHGFDDWCMWTGFETGNRPSGRRYWDPYINTPEGSKTHAGKFGPDLYTDFVIDFLGKHKDEPMMVYYAMALPHTPFVHTPHKPDAKTNMEKHIAMVEYADHLLGRIMKSLEDLGIRDNTIVFWTTDNGTVRSIAGEYLGRKCRGGKATDTERGTNAPFIIGCPGLIKEGVVTDALTDFSDMLPTFAELAGVPVPMDQVLTGTIDGHSLVPFLFGRTNDTSRSWIMAQGHGPARLDAEGVRGKADYGVRTVRNKRFKIKILAEKPLTVEGNRPYALFDLENDWYTTRNVYRNPEFAEPLAQLIEAAKTFPERDARPAYDPTPPQSWDIKNPR